MTTIKTTTVEIFFEDLKNDFPELRDQNGNLIKDDQLLTVAETLDDEEILEKHIELKKYLHNNYHRFDSVNLPEYIEKGENLKVIDSDYCGAFEGIVLTIEYSI